MLKFCKKKNVQWTCGDKFKGLQLSKFGDNGFKMFIAVLADRGVWGNFRNYMSE